jgi:hypothetical protein
VGLFPALLVNFPHYPLCPLHGSDDHATGTRAVARVEQVISCSEVTSNQDSRNNGDYAFTAFIHERRDSSIIRFLFAIEIQLVLRVKCLPTFSWSKPSNWLCGEPPGSALELSAVCHFTAHSKKQEGKAMYSKLVSLSSALLLGTALTLTAAAQEGATEKAREQSMDTVGQQNAQHEPHMAAALQHLRQAEEELEKASANKGGHLIKAMELTKQAEAQVTQGMQYYNKNVSPLGQPKK